MRIILIIALISICHSAYSQTSKESFDEAVNLLNCKSIELSLKKGSKGADKSFQDNCDCNASPQFETIKESIPGSETRTIELSKEIESIKNNEFKSSFQTAEVIDLLTEAIFTNQKKYNRLFTFAESRKSDSAFSNLKSKLKNDLGQLFNRAESLMKPENINELKLQYDEIDKRVDDLEQSTANTKKAKSLISIEIDVISLLVTLIGLILLFFVLKNLRVKEDFVSERVRDYVKDKISNAQITPTTGSISTYEIRELKNEIEKLKGEIRDLKFSHENINAEPRTLIQEFKTPESKSTFSDTLYLSTPNIDGSFNESSAQSSYREGASIYKFKKISNNKAEFQIDERESSIKLALQYPDKNIDPVCDAQNAFNAKSKTIITITDGAGEVELIGDKWRLNRKAKIRYEN